MPEAKLHDQEAQVRYGGPVDEITERAIMLLRRDGRASFSDLARRLGTTRANVTRHISPMLEDGSLRVIAAVHPRLLGLDVLAHLMVRAEGDISALAQRIAQIDAAVFISEITGTMQIVIELHLTTLSELQSAVREVRAMPGVTEVAVMLYERMLRSFFLGEEPRLYPHALDEVDLQIMELLQVDGRLGYAEMSEQVGLSISGCRTRVTRLIESGVMQIGAVVRREQADAEGLAFGFGIVLDGDDAAALELLLAEPSLEFLARGVGRYDMVATITFHSLAEFTDLLGHVRAAPGVRHVDQWMHARIHMERYQNSLHRIRAAREVEGGRTTA
jgi:DNA-binding Lrp family transcriptional regulator